MGFTRVAALGAEGHNEMTRAVCDASGRVEVFDFYDLQLGNWDINADWRLKRDDYDLIILTRCAYFAADPSDLIRRCRRHTLHTGHVLIDWGLGDHWRFPEYRVGWERNGVHEYHDYGEHRSYLHSCFWEPKFEQEHAVEMFRDMICQHGYSDDRSLTDIVNEEIPRLVNSDDHMPCLIDFLSLWPDSPQLYILTAFEGTNVI